MLEEYSTVASAAAQTGLEYKTLLARIARGKVEAVRKGARILLIHRDEIARIKKRVGA